MLNTFPQLLAYGLLAPVLLRTALGLFFILSGYEKLSLHREHFVSVFHTLRFPFPLVWVWGIGIIEFIGGLLFLIGLFTQITAILLSLILVLEIFIKLRNPTLIKKGFWFCFLSLAVTISLVFSGAGFFSLDLPL